MLIEGTFLTLHKWLDLALVAGAHGWQWRPYYQVPKLFNYSYGGQGLHVENVYDPFADTAYTPGPIYNRMMDVVDLLGQGPNPTWHKERKQMVHALEITNRALSYRQRPEWKHRSLKAEGYWTKQFSLSLHLQFIVKYFPNLVVNFFEHKVFSPLGLKFPTYWNKFEHHVRKIDYLLANKSLGYHLVLDALEQVNTPLDEDDKIVPYDYISVPGKKIMQNYKDFTYLSEMQKDAEREMKEYGKKYADFCKIAKEEKLKALQRDDPMADRFIIPNFAEYCIKFLDVDIHDKTNTLIELKRTTRDYLMHLSLGDNLIRFFHKLWFAHNNELYNKYWRDIYEVRNLEEAMEKIKKQKEEAESINLNQKLSMNPYLKTTPATTRYEQKELEKLTNLQRDARLRWRESATRLTRENIKQMRSLVGTDPFLLEEEFEKNYQYLKRNGTIKPQDQEEYEKAHRPKLFYPNSEQFDAELMKLQQSVVEEVINLLPNTITDKNFLEPIMKDYYNDRVNQYMYVHYPHLLDEEVKTKLDFRYDKDQYQVYSEFINNRITNKQKKHQERLEVLAPYKVIQESFKHQHLYHIDRKAHMAREALANFGEEEPEGNAEMSWGGEPVDIEDLQPGQSLAQLRYLTRQRHEYQQMMHDMEQMTKHELEKAKNITSPIDRRRTMHWLEQSGTHYSNPLGRIKSGLPPRTTTRVQNDRWDVGNITRGDMKYVTKAFPGVGLDQFLTVMDQHDTAQPPKKGSMRGKEEFVWKGMPRNKDGQYGWRQAYLDDLKYKEEQKDMGLRQLYAHHLHAIRSDPRNMRNQYVLSEAAEEQFQPPKM